MSSGTGFHVMGVINATPDSFYAGSRVSGDALIDAAASMVAGGASMIDVGGESTRPGSDYVSLEEELSRVLPAIRAIRSRWEITLSVDTRKAEVARQSVDAGADVVNDVSALYDDPEMAPLCARLGVPVILMHKKGIPATMQDKPYYENCAAEVFSWLLAAAERARSAGIPGDKIILDPGIGFGKRLEDNLDILNRLDELCSSGYPVLVGMSRKAFLGAITGREASQRLSGSLAAACMARERGARIFRVHDVAETLDALRVCDAILSGKGLRVPIVK